jgi:hypothetical protein
VQTGSGAHAVFYPIGTGVLSPGVKRPVREAEDTSLTIGEVMNTRVYASTPFHGFHGVVLS